MAPSKPLGELEQTLMLAILRAGEHAYGVAIREEVRLCTGRIIAPGALYTTLDRLERKGLVHFHAAAPTPERGGKAKNLYKVTARGKRELAAAQTNFRALLQGLDLIGDPDA